jgi:hypothetical protein
MTLAKIDPRNRNTLRFHGWLLALWAFSVGLLTSAILLHVFRVHSLAIRYALGAAAIYLLGFVWGGWWYAKWWNARPRSTADFPTHASAADEQKYNQEQDAIAKKFSKFDGLGNLPVSGGDDPLSALLLIIVLIIVAVFMVLLLGYTPLLMTDLFAGYLAEILLEFVIGGLLLRQVNKPRPLDEYWRLMLRKSILAGLLFVAVAASLGWFLQQNTPEAQTLLQVLR